VIFHFHIFQTCTHDEPALSIVQIPLSLDMVRPFSCKKESTMIWSGFQSDYNKQGMIHAPCYVDVGARLEYTLGGVTSG